MSVIKQSNAILKDPITSPDMSGDVIEQIYTYTFAKAFTAATDILEFAALIPYGRIVNARIIGENIGATTLTVGFMSGAFKSLDPTRTSGAELFSAVVGNVEAQVPLLTLAGLALNGGEPVSIGLKVGADIAAGATKKVHLKLAYIASAT